MLYIPSASIQPIRQTNISGTVDVPLSPTFATADEYQVDIPRAETSSGASVVVRPVKFPTFLRLIVDAGITAAFVECNVTPRGG